MTPRSARRTPRSGSGRDLALPPALGLGSSQAVAPAQSSSHSASQWLTAPLSTRFRPHGRGASWMPPSSGAAPHSALLAHAAGPDPALVARRRPPPLESVLSCLIYSRPTASRTIRLPTTPRVSASSDPFWGLRPTPSGGWFSRFSCHREGHPTLPSWILPFPSRH